MDASSHLRNVKELHIPMHGRLHRKLDASEIAT